MLLSPCYQHLGPPQRLPPLLGDAAYQLFPLHSPPRVLHLHHQLSELQAVPRQVSTSHCSQGHVKQEVEGNRCHMLSLAPALPGGAAAVTALRASLLWEGLGDYLASSTCRPSNKRYYYKTKTWLKKLCVEIPFIRAVDRALSGFRTQRAGSCSQAGLLIAIPAAADWFCSPGFCQAETRHAAMPCVKSYTFLLHPLIPRAQRN